jgi:proline dehydrogenase
VLLLQRLLLRLSSKPAIGRGLERFPVSKRVVRRFVAGERAEEAVEVLARLDADGFHSAVTYLGENVTTDKAARAAADTYCRLLEEIHRRGLRTTPSLKLTHLGLDLGEEIAVENVERVLDQASGRLVWVDMEGSAYTDRTLAVYRRLRARWANVACVLQAYLYRTEADLISFIPEGATVRLCKGAYREPPDRAYPQKVDVDCNYVRLAGLLLSPEAQRAGAYPGFATHDERIIRVITDRTRELGIASPRPSLLGWQPGPCGDKRARGARPDACPDDRSRATDARARRDDGARRRLNRRPIARTRSCDSDQGGSRSSPHRVWTDDRNDRRA